MQRLKENIVKGYITSIVGTTTMILTLILIATKVFDFVWEGVAGLCVGLLLLISPKDIGKIIMEGIRSWGKRGGYYDNYDQNQNNGDI